MRKTLASSQLESYAENPEKVAETSCGEMSRSTAPWAHGPGFWCYKGSHLAMIFQIQTLGQKPESKLVRNRRAQEARQF